MSSYQGHLLGGAATFFLLSKLISPLLPASHLSKAILLCFTLLGSLFPDVDIKSMGQKIFYHLLAILLGILALQRNWEPFIILSILAVIPLIARHRGITHNPYFLMVTPFALSFILAKAFPAIHTVPLRTHLFFISGAFSHLFLDYGPRGFLKKFLSR